nr:hypothetical protein Hi04_10k_c1000_00022 [uncultured bacterium]
MRLLLLLSLLLLPACRPDVLAADDKRKLILDLMDAGRPDLAMQAVETFYSRRDHRVCAAMGAGLQVFADTTRAYQLPSPPAALQHAAACVGDQLSTSSY